jgi:Fe-S-cluster-containing hydrogenase component 2/CRP-like cAMP-binding protein/thioredoxin reductase
MAVSPSAHSKMLFADAQAEYDIVIIGSGPSGISAAARAAALDAKHILLEAENHLADTLFKFQKGKHVMAEPSVLPLRSDLPFDAGLRETVLENWNKGAREKKINVAMGKRVKAMSREESTRVITVICEDGSEYTTRTVILGIGMQGNLRKLGVEGENLPQVQYTLSDPDEYKGENIIVIGAGDAGIENALGLMKQNSVYMVNRAGEFALCKDGNRDLILKAEKNGNLKVCYSANTIRVEATGTEPPLNYFYSGTEGEASIPCHRVIARLGAIPPRKLVESFGIKFQNDSPVSLPILSEKYESTVPGVFVVGALSGYPLIKQALNQGYELVEMILGRPIEPVDEPFLRERIKAWKPQLPVTEVLALACKNMPLLREMSTLQLREFMLHSRIIVPKKGEVIFKKYDYTNTFFSIIQGSVSIEIEDKEGQIKHIKSNVGSFFGEMGLLSGRRRTATIIANENCALIETPRTTMLRMIETIDGVRRIVDESFLRNAIYNYIGSMVTPEAVQALIDSGIEKRKYQTGQALFSEGDEADGLYLIRTGSVIVSNKTNRQQDRILSYLAAGNYVGEMALINEDKRSATVKAAVATEVMVLKADAFKRQLDAIPALRQAMAVVAAERTRSNIMKEESASDSGDMTNFLVKQGVGKGSDVLVINESLCVRCNSCETACAETHNGTGRLVREAGPTYGDFHIPVACRHCEDPACMKDCPPDAISRTKDGAVVISDACIGCGNCERNCPFSVIQLAVQKPPKSGGGILWMLFGIGERPGNRRPDYDPDARKKAVKCDLCQDKAGGPACVRACPTGAAVRMAPEKIFSS